jgi:hypothetical protein
MYPTAALAWSLLGLYKLDPTALQVLSKYVYPTPILFAIACLPHMSTTCVRTCRPHVTVRMYTPNTVELEATSINKCKQERERRCRETSTYGEVSPIAVGLDRLD